MTTRLTIEQLERMKTHELADLLVNVAFVLRRMPNIECQQLSTLLPYQEPPTEILQQPVMVSAFTAAELKKKTLVELREIAMDIQLSVPKRMKKDELIQKLLTR
jgi:hypothetical protein